MHVLHVNEHLALKGGVETYLLSLLPLLSAKGIRSTFVFAKGDTSLFEPARSLPAISETRFRSQDAARKQMSDILREESPDVIHVHNIQSVGVLDACLSYGATIMTAHDYRSICPASTFFYKRTKEVCHKTRSLLCFTTTLTKHCLTPRPRYATYFYHRARWISRNAHRFAGVIAPSGGARERLTQAGFEEEKVEVLPYFCPVAPAQHPRPVPSSPTITFMGRISPNKGHEYFIQALGMLPANVRGIMVGNFSPETEIAIQKLAKEHRCDDRLSMRMWASRDEVTGILDQTTVFIFPSLWPETLGIVGLEALSRGVPVVASDVGGVREWLKDQINGRVVQPKEPGQIRNAVLELIASEEKLIAYGKNGIDTIKERFLPPHHTSQLVQRYERVAFRN